MQTNQPKVHPSITSFIKLSQTKHLFPCLNYSKARYLGNQGQPLTGKPAEIIKRAKPLPACPALPSGTYLQRSQNSLLPLLFFHSSLGASLRGPVCCAVSLTPRDVCQHPPS